MKMTDSEALAVLDGAVAYLPTRDDREDMRQARAHIAEALRDAARWRTAREADADTGVPYIALERQDSWGNWKTQWLQGSDADTAIDAAMKEAT